MSDNPSCPKAHCLAECPIDEGTPVEVVIREASELALTDADKSNVNWLREFVCYRMPDPCCEIMVAPLTSELNDRLERALALIERLTGENNEVG